MPKTRSGDEYYIPIHQSGGTGWFLMLVIFAIVVAVICL